MQCFKAWSGAKAGQAIKVGVCSSGDGVKMPGEQIQPFWKCILQERSF